jgi:hypothetical protein
MSQALLARLERHTCRVESGCWEWTASCDRAGYGRLMVQKRLRVAHRLSYELRVGLIPEGLVLDHLCRNPRCINPAHLEAVSQQENVQRGAVPRSRNREKTHCPAGHPYAGANLYRRPGGGRTCLACQRESRRRRNRGPVLKTHCPAGHPYEAANVLICRKKNGGEYRRCATCVRALDRRRWPGRKDRLTRHG